MMRSTNFNKVLLTGLLWFVFTSGWAAPVTTSVLVEIQTIDMTEKEVENVISEPIEILLGSLDDVFMVSAKYSPNKAVISVDFSELSAEPQHSDVLITRVKNTVDSYMDKLPQSIDSISVSLGDIAVSDKVESQSIKDSPAKPLKNNRNTSATKSTIEIPLPIPMLPDSAPLAIEKPGIIRSAGKRSMAGRYLGSIESSNEFLPVITTLLPSTNINDDVTVGKYYMNEQDEIVTGQLSACYSNSGTVLTCQWRDKYGAGGVDFIFTPDYSVFNGRWSIGGKEGAYKWSGIQVKDN